MKTENRTVCEMENETWFRSDPEVRRRAKAARAIPDTVIWPVKKIWRKHFLLPASITAVLYMLAQVGLPFIIAITGVFLCLVYLIVQPPYSKIAIYEYEIGIRKPGDLLKGGGDGK